MVRIEITKSLFQEIEKTFKKDAVKIFDLIETLNEIPRKGKAIGNVGSITIKELKYKSFRFYFIADGFKLKFFDVDGLQNLLLRFVRMSDKKDQQKTILEIKHILIKIGFDGFK